MSYILAKYEITRFRHMLPPYLEDGWGIFPVGEAIRPIAYATDKVLIHACVAELNRPPRLEAA